MYIDNLKLRYEYEQLVLNYAKYEYFITVEFADNQDEYECNRQINYLLHLLNLKIFTRDYDDEYVDGFAFIEKSSDSNHYYLLIRNDDRWDINDGNQFIDLFFECLDKVKTKNDKKAFVRNDCDIRKIHEIFDLVHYLTKPFERSGDPSFIQPLYKYGIARMSH